MPFGDDMNTKRRENCQLRNDWKERIIRIGDEQTSLQNQFDNLRNDFSDNSPRLEALETGLNSLDGRVIITETDIINNTARITANENDIDRIDAELVNKTGDINALANRMTLAEGEIDNIDARLIGIETGEILYSQLTMDADKDFEGRAIINPGLVDGVDIGSHVHSGAVGQGAKINLKDVVISEDKDFGGSSLLGVGSINNMMIGPVADELHLFPSTERVLVFKCGPSSTVGFSVRSTGFRPIYKNPINLGEDAIDNRFKNLYLTENIYLNGVVDGVDVSEHTHDGTAIGGKKINLKDVVITSSTNFNLTNLNDVGTLYGVRANLKDPYPLILGRPGHINRRFVIWPDKMSIVPSVSVDGTDYDDSKGIDIDNLGNLKVPNLHVSGDANVSSITSTGAITGASVSASGAITQNNGMPVLSIIPTAPSDNVRYSHDAEASTLVTGSTNKVLLKKFTFSQYAPTLARVKYDVRGTSGTSAYTEVRKNGVLIGVESLQSGADYVTKSQDLNIDIKPGDTLELWGSTSSSAGSCRVRNFRICFDAGVPDGVSIS